MKSRWLLNNTANHAEPPSVRLRTNTSWFVSRNRMALVVVGLVLAWLLLSVTELLVERHAPNAQITTIDNALWWGIVTMMTVGYGDLVPVTNVGRILASLLMMTGVGSIGIISAKLSAYFLSQVLLEGRGQVDPSKVRNHVIVCGWKDDMADLLEHVLQLNRNLKSRDLVVVANRKPEDVTALRANERLANVTVILGEYYQQSTLQRAAPHLARKVLILADASAGADGRKTSATEADARTIMTAIALSNIAKGTSVAAEIIDPSLDHYLHLAGISEIVYTRELNRQMLGNAAGGLGLVNVFHDLVDPACGSFITTRDIPAPFVGGEYGAFRRDFEQRHQDILVIGIMENTGNPHLIKAEAFKEAQRTPSIGHLIDNLRTVKSLRCNNPVFHPQSDYRIAKGAAAIVLVNEQGASRGLHQDKPVDMDNAAA